MAPEQLLGEPVDHRADIFAYGVMAFEVLTGQKPFVGQSSTDILKRQIKRGSEFKTPRSLNPEIHYLWKRSSSSRWNVIP